MWIIRIPMTRERIIKCIHEGIRKAKKKYEKEMRTRWITEPGPESELVRGICVALRRRHSRNESDEREYSFGDIRVDIALLNNQRNPYCVIEVKPNWDWQRAYQDLDKIYSLVKDGSLERGFLAVFLKQRSDGQGMDMDHRIHNIVRHIERDYGRRVLNFGFKRCDISRERFANNEWETSSLSIEIFA